MKILYSIQNTGNGHLARAREIIPILKNKFDFDILVSGTEGGLSLNHSIKYKRKGISFTFGKKGNIDYLATIKKLNLKQTWHDINTLPIENYDFVINDFEPISAWAAKLKKIPCFSLSHQAAVQINNKDYYNFFNLPGRLILKYYAPSVKKFGFDFEENNNNVFTPIIRKEIRNQEISNLGHYTVYLPSYSDNYLIKYLSQFEKIEWQIFSKETETKYQNNNVTIYPVNSDLFVKSIASSEGVLCGAGFETPSEALYLGKKLFVIPMKGQYEQQYNAFILSRMGIDFVKNLNKKSNEKILNWIKNNKTIEVNYSDNAELVINKIISNYLYEHSPNIALDFS